MMFMIKQWDIHPQVSWFSCNRRVDLLKSPCPSMVMRDPHLGRLLKAASHCPWLTNSGACQLDKWWRCMEMQWNPPETSALVLKCIECVPKTYWLMTQDSWSEPHAWTPPIRFKGPLFSRRSCAHSNGHKRWGKPQRSCVEDPWTTCGIQV